MLLHSHRLAEGFHASQIVILTNFVIVLSVGIMRVDYFFCIILKSLEKYELVLTYKKKKKKKKEKEKNSVLTLSIQLDRPEQTV